MRSLQLPSEIIFLILRDSDIAKSTSYRNLALVSRVFYNLTIPLMWSDIRVTTVQQLALISNLLSKCRLSNNKGKFIKKLAITVSLAELNESILILDGMIPYLDRLNVLEVSSVDNIPFDLPLLTNVYRLRQLEELILGLPLSNEQMKWYADSVRTQKLRKFRFGGFKNELFLGADKIHQNFVVEAPTLEILEFGSTDVTELDRVSGCISEDPNWLKLTAINTDGMVKSMMYVRVEKATSSGCIAIWLERMKCFEMKNLSSFDTAFVTQLFRKMKNLTHLHLVSISNFDAQILADVVGQLEFAELNDIRSKNLLDLFYRISSSSSLKNICISRSFHSSTEADAAFTLLAGHPTLKSVQVRCEFLSTHRLSLFLGSTPSLRSVCIQDSQDRSEAIINLFRRNRNVNHINLSGGVRYVELFQIFLPKWLDNTIRKKKSFKLPRLEVDSRIIGMSRTKVNLYFKRYPALGRFMRVQF
ncbi:hypothetical protein BKA69DRAFT_1097895 [Paraphysoderma sedebokerense]|nr:hypothetical protein BKA69DRAFT_1097895 [Paraphysoderma sedebokerense]